MLPSDMRAGQVRALALAGLIGIWLSAGAAAQTTPVQPQPRDPNMPAQQNTPPEKVAPGSGDAKTGETTGTLSDKLERSDGVISPPDTGTGRVITPADPNPGSGMVIPPSGTPGSPRPGAVPK